MTWDVAKVYRVTVRYPRIGRGQAVKLGGQQVVSQTWRYYLECYAMAQRRLRHSQEAGNAEAVAMWEQVLANAVFKVEVAPSAAFQDISASYDVNTALAARESLRTINHAG